MLPRLHCLNEIEIILFVAFERDYRSHQYCLFWFPLSSWPCSYHLIFSLLASVTFNICFGYRYASDSSGDTKEFYVDLSSPGEVDKRLRALQRRLQEEEDSITATSMEDFTRGN